MPAKPTDSMPTAEVAKPPGLAQNTLRKWASRGVIPPHRNPGNSYRRFKRSDLEKFLEKVEQPVIVSAKRKPD